MQRCVCVYTIILFIFLTPCCRSTKTGLGKNDAGTLQQIPLGKFDDSVDKIVFLTFDVTLLDSIREAYSFKLASKTIADGLLKQHNLTKTNNPEPGYFYCELHNSNKEVIDLIKAEDPLNRVYEFPSDNNSMGKAQVKTHSGSMMLRFQYKRDVKYLGIYKFSSATKKFNNIYYAELLP